MTAACLESAESRLLGDTPPVHVLHAIHDFLPRHQAGSELYALRLAREQARRHHVTILCADFDPSRDHGDVNWRVHEGLPIVELVNNWRSATFADTYRSPVIGERVRHALDTLRPDVVHVHNLLNLSFDLPAMARAMRIPVVATLHDYTLVCASGGQRVHRRDHHVCHDIDVNRCATCFTDSVFFERMTFGSLVKGGATGRIVSKAAMHARRVMPLLLDRAAKTLKKAGGIAVTADEIAARLEAARAVFDAVDLFVAPSADLAREFVRFGIPAAKMRVSDYGMPAWSGTNGHVPARPVRIGMVGTLVWHKGAHVLIEALHSLPPGSFTAKIFGSLTTFPAYVAELRASAAGLPIDFMDAFPPEDAAKAYRDFDVLVVPSLWPENSPLVIHEAFQAHVPIVASRIGGIPDLIDDGASGVLFEPGSASDLASKLAALVAEPGQLGVLSSAAPTVKTVAQDADEWDTAYAELTGSSGSRGASVFSASSRS